MIGKNKATERESLVALDQHTKKNNSTLDQSLKLRIVLAAIDEHISYQMAEELIKYLGLRGI